MVIHHKRFFGLIVYLSTIPYCLENPKFENQTLDTPLSPEQEQQFLEAVRLRKEGCTKDAFEVGKVLVQNHPSLKSYNIYLASAYDLLTKSELKVAEFKKIFDAAFEFYKQTSYELNLAATLLKCCNYLIDRGIAENALFDDIYNKGTAEENESNSYIMVQYFKRLVTDRKEQQVRVVFERLPYSVKTNHALLNVLKGLKTLKIFADPNGDVKIDNDKLTRITVVSDIDHLKCMQELLCDFSLILRPIDIASDDLVSELNRNTYKAPKAIFVVPNFDSISEEDLSLWTFAMGYCIHKFGKNNIITLCENNVSDSNPPFRILSRFIETHTYNSEMDIIKILGRRGVLFG